VTATSAYLGVTDNSAFDLARNITIYRLIRINYVNNFF